MTVALIVASVAILALLFLLGGVLWALGTVEAKLSEYESLLDRMCGELGSDSKWWYPEAIKLLLGEEWHQ